MATLHMYMLEGRGEEERKEGGGGPDQQALQHLFFQLYLIAINI